MGIPLGTVGARMTQGGHGPHPAESQSVRPKFSDVALLHDRGWEGKVRLSGRTGKSKHPAHSFLIFHG